MGSRHLAVVVAPHLERADALAKLSHGEDFFIALDRDRLYGGLQIFLANDGWILRDLVFNVRVLVAQPRLLVRVSELWKHLLLVFGYCTVCKRRRRGTPLTRVWRNVKMRDGAGKTEGVGVADRVGRRCAPSSLRQIKVPAGKCSRSPSVSAPSAV
jgi:hypothetical protein